MVAGADEQAVERWATISRFGAPDEQPLLLLRRLPPDAVVVDLHMAVIDTGERAAPLAI